MLKKNEINCRLYHKVDYYCIYCDNKTLKYNKIKHNKTKKHINNVKIILKIINENS
jgi:hypothetical protein